MKGDSEIKGIDGDHKKTGKLQAHRLKENVTSLLRVLQWTFIFYKMYKIFIWSVVSANVYKIILEFWTNLNLFKQSLKWKTF